MRLIRPDSQLSFTPSCKSGDSIARDPVSSLVPRNTFSSVLHLPLDDEDGHENQALDDLIDVRRIAECIEPGGDHLEDDGSDSGTGNRHSSAEGINAAENGDSDRKHEIGAAVARRG